MALKQVTNSCSRGDGCRDHQLLHGVGQDGGTAAGRQDGQMVHFAEESDVAGGGRSWRSTAVGLAQMLIVPQGFTLAVAGSVTICVGRHGFPGPVGVWLFVRGRPWATGSSSRSSELWAARPPAGGDCRSGAAQRHRGLRGTARHVANWWIPNEDFAFLVTGLAVHMTYIPLAAAGLGVLWSTSKRRRPSGPP